VIYTAVGGDGHRLLQDFSFKLARRIGRKKEQLLYFRRHIRHYGI